MRCKICGITSYEDAMDAINAGADALGFVFYEKSPRYLSLEEAKKIIEKLPPFVEKVALFVNVDASFVNEACHFTKATLAQIHFDAPQSFFDALLVPYLRVVRAKSREDIQQNHNRYCLIDAYCEAYGGVGKKLNIEWFKDIDCSKIILAGGLTPQNIVALKEYGFYGFDVSSGVEREAGKKDAQKIKEFIENAH